MASPGADERKLDNDSTRPAAPAVVGQPSPSANAPAAQQHTQNTQPATQPLSPDNLRHSGLTPADSADVFCILHPTSAAASHAVQLTALVRPGHVLLDQQTAVESTGHDASSGSRNSGRATATAGSTDGGLARRPVGIALRLSQFKHLRKPSRGWVFGRNPHEADVCIAKFENASDMERKISNQHYRIYVNGHGIVMLEDTSTNGTIVEGELVSARRKRGAGPSRMLTQGCTVQLLMDATNPINFVVSYPTRPANVQHEFEQRYRDWIVTSIRAGLIAPPESDYDREYSLVSFKEESRPSYELEKWEKQNRGAAGAANLISVPSANYAFGMSWNGAPHFSVIGMIGKGAFATVYKVATKADGRIFACKELDKRSLARGKKAAKMINQEMTIMARLSHPHIVQFHDSYMPPLNDKHLYIVMEHVRHGELATYLAEHPDGRLPEEEVRLIADQVIHAIEYLHVEKVTHRDIKPENILIASWDPLRVKLSDFGLSKLVNGVAGGMGAQEDAAVINGTFLKTFCGTLLYCAPEVYPGFDKYRKYRDHIEARDETIMEPVQFTNWVFGRRKRPKPHTYDQAVDIWSYGAVMYHLLTGKPPFMPTTFDKHGAAMLKNIMTTEPDWQILDEIGVSEPAKRFFSKVLKRFPEDRPDEVGLWMSDWLRVVDRQFDYEQCIWEARCEMHERSKGLKTDWDLCEINEYGDYIDPSLDYDKMKAEQASLIALARRIGFTKAAYIAYEKGQKQGKAEVEEEEEHKEADGQNQERNNTPQKKRKLHEKPSFQDDEVRKIVKTATPETPKSVKRQPLTTPTKSAKRQRTTDTTEMTTPTNAAKRQRTAESVATKETVTTEPTGVANEAPRTPPSQVDHQMLDNAKTLTPRLTAGRRPYVTTDDEVDAATTSPAKRQRPSPAHACKKDASPRAGARAARRSVTAPAAGSPTKQVTNPFPASSGKPGKITPSALRTKHFRLDDSDKDCGPSEADMTEDEKDVPVHSFGLSVEITASLGLKQWDADRNARAIIDERNVFANGVKIAGKGGSPAIAAAAPKQRKRRSSVSDLGDPAEAAQKAMLQENGRPRSSGSETTSVQNGSMNGNVGRRDISGRRPPSVRLAEINPNEAESKRNGAKLIPEALMESTHPNPFHKPAPKLPSLSLHPPPAELGKLIPVQGSFYPRSIPLHERLTSWGRGLNTSVPYPDLYDYRIPKYALEIAFWAPGIESLIESGANWKTVPHISTILGTKASGSIYVNGVELRKETPKGDARCFGKIYSGDIITIYKDKKCFLAFRCVFFHGEGRMKRPSRDRPFKILEAKYPGGVDPERRDARGGSVVSRTTDHGIGAATCTSTRRGTPVSRRGSACESGAAIAELAADRLSNPMTTIT